ncbi:hypothetical protein QJS10_CPB15g01724 [Acorus calamus]|uniref:3'-5' exonuclease domain-containing protein n=1 Tax=Acorus calamus TaxID=4465 RepID=A0AAV9DA45_ACOCL|nr:hypothetical protein QJS10_CPB15g01724 [Acorus calamus]
MNHPPIGVEQLRYTETEFIVHIFHLAHVTTVVTASAAEASMWVNDFLSAYNNDNNHDEGPTRFLVGLDAKWSPDYGIAVLQLCVDRRCLIFQIVRCGAIPDALSDFLCDTRFTFTGVRIHDNVRRLILDYDVSVANVMDLRTLFVVERERVRLRHKELGLGTAILMWRARNLRSVELENWEAERLSMDQIRYACMDAFIPFEVARRVFG